MLNMLQKIIHFTNKYDGLRMLWMLQQIFQNTLPVMKLL
jgi:hypothetical protein